jgi:hypothetical protein
MISKVFMFSLACMLWHASLLAQTTIPENTDSATHTKENVDTFKHLRFTYSGQVGAGYVVIKEGGDGIVTVNLEMGIQARYYLATDDKVFGGKRARDVSFFLRAGSGPMLVRDGVVPIFWSFNPGITYNYLRTNVSYGFLLMENFNRTQRPGYLYGVSASLEKIQVPFFVHVLTGERIHYIVIGGFRVPLSSFVPLNFRRSHERRLLNNERKLQH